MKKLSKSLGKNFNAIMEFFLKRAPVYLRINRNKINIKEAIIKLEDQAFYYASNYQHYLS